MHYGSIGNLWNTSQFISDVLTNKLNTKDVIVDFFDSFKDSLIASWNQEHKCSIKITDNAGLERCVDYLEQDFDHYKKLYFDQAELDSDLKDRLVQRYGDDNAQAIFRMRITATHLHSQTANQALKNRLFEFGRNLPKSN